MTDFKSWGNYPQLKQSRQEMRDRFSDFPGGDRSILPSGNGRSYGDSCLNGEGLLLGSALLKNYIEFDKEAGVICCEAGILFSEIIDLVLPHGWFLPVTPGTKFVSVGGALANDVHGKNHHLEGSFGHHVKQFELLRSDGSRVVCSRDHNADLFSATIGGLGLTGFVVWVEFSLKKVAGNALKTENIKYHRLQDFFDLSAESEKDYEYTVAWVDCMAKGSNLGRGHFSRANHVNGHVESGRRNLSVPFTPPLSLVNSLTLKAFNQLYFNRQVHTLKASVDHYDPFFYPLDSILNWNRIYGPKGFLQYQFVVDMGCALDVISDILSRIAHSGMGSFLAVLKVFGEQQSPGLLSFPRRGATLALDFPYKGQKTLSLFDQFDEVIAQAGGRIYPAKDAHTSAKNFQLFYPQWQQLEQHRDPAINSSYWRRVSGVVE